MGIAHVLWAQYMSYGQITCAILPVDTVHLVYLGCQVFEIGREVFGPYSIPHRSKGTTLGQFKLSILTVEKFTDIDWATRNIEIKAFVFRVAYKSRRCIEAVRCQA